MDSLIKFHYNISEKINENIDYLNWGGCGFFAYYVSKKLKMNGYNPEIIVLDRNITDISEKKYILENIRKNNRVDIRPNSLSASHFMVKCNGFLFDSESICRSNIKIGDIVGDDAMFIGVYTIEEMALALYKDVYGWNSTYKRSNNPFLYEIVKSTPI